MEAARLILILLLIAIASIQFIRPVKNNGGYESIVPFEKETKPSKKISIILKENCYHCHSDQTNYPWYAEIAPFSFWLNDNITRGKEHFNVSIWESYSVKKKEHKLEELIKMIEEHKMPLPSFAIIHGNLSSEERKLLMQWAGVARLQYKHKLEVSLN